MVSRLSFAAVLAWTTLAHATPPAGDEPDGTLAVQVVHRTSVLDCARHDLAVRVRSPRGDTASVPAEALLEGRCEGVCTAQAQREGRRKLRELEAAVKRGESSESELDYNFTDCIALVPELALSVRLPDLRAPLAPRDVAIVREQTMGPHDVPNTAYRLALARCGAPFVGHAFGATYANRWDANALQLTRHQEAAGEVVTVFVFDPDGMSSPPFPRARLLYRVTLPPHEASARACAAPFEVVGAAE